MLDSKPRLLVIDDDAQIRRVFARVLRNEFTIETEADGAEALRRLAYDPGFDVILCDHNLGNGMSGEDFFDSLGRMSDELQSRIVFCSGLDPDPADAFATGLGERFFMKLDPIGMLILLLHRATQALHL